MSANSAVAQQPVCVEGHTFMKGTAPLHNSPHVLKDIKGTAPIAQQFARVEEHTFINTPAT